MKRFARIISLATLASFVWLAGVESCHHHQDAQGEAHCLVCQISHQARAVIQAPPVIHSPVISGDVVLAVVSQPVLLFALSSHGLSPPAL